jgi:methylated-DNA-protein-cysteine methyltransferase-like protein
MKSDTYLQIWQTVRKIPRGKVSTYGAIAEESGFFGQPRLVGYALHNLPLNSDVPWHRVINARGAISFPEGSRQYARQKKLLRSEGLIFTGEKISLVRYGWKWPGHR